MGRWRDWKVFFSLLNECLFYFFDDPTTGLNLPFSVEDK